MRVRVYQTLYFFHSVNNENVNQIFASAVQPVVEWSGAFGELQV